MTTATNNIFRKILFIGDPHFKVNNNDVIDVFVEKCLEHLRNLKELHKEDLLCVIGGDVLDTHERLHQTPYNKAIKFIDNIRKITPCVVLVGNHDFENNQQFLTDKHWMNPLKEWKDVYIVDKVLCLNNIIFVPYVPPGRFLEALDTYSSTDWRDAECIFAHQEFKGCSMNNVISENGDKWPLHYPQVISGHIHKAHRPQKNIYYPGSIIQHTFGELDNNNGLYFLNLDTKEEKTISINIPKLTSIEIPCETFDSTVKNITLKPLQKIRIVCTGTDEQFKRIKKTNLYNNLPVGISVTFKTMQQQEDEKEQSVVKFEEFDTILNNTIGDNAEMKNIFSHILSGSTFQALLTEVTDKISKTDVEE